MSSEQYEVDRVSTIEKTHEFLRKYDNDVFGPFKVFKHHATDELILMKEKTTNSKVELSHEIASVEKRFNFSHANLMEMKDWAVEKKSQMCATFYQVKTYF